MQNLQTTVADIVKQLKKPSVHYRVVPVENELGVVFSIPSRDHTALRLMETNGVPITDENPNIPCYLPGCGLAPCAVGFIAPELTYKEFNLDIKDNFGKIPHDALW